MVKVGASKVVNVNPKFNIRVLSHGFLLGLLSLDICGFQYILFVLHAKREPYCLVPNIIIANSVL